MAEEILIQFRADIESLKKDFATVKTQLADIDKTGKATADNLGKNIQGVASNSAQLRDGLFEIGRAVGIAFSVGAVINFGKESVKAFIEAEENANRLRFTLTKIGNEGEAAFKKLLAQSSELQNISIFSDDSIQQAQTALATFGLTAKQIEALIPKVLDLASATDKDLGSATQKVIQGINGQIRGLKSVGITYEDTGSKTKNLGVLMEKLGKFTGATGEALTTNAGKFARFNNLWDDLKEKVGEFAITAADGSGAIDLLEIAFTDLTFAQVQERKIMEELTRVNNIYFDSFVEGSQKQRAAMLQAGILRSIDLREQLEVAGNEEKDGIRQRLQANTNLLKQMSAEEFKYANERQGILDDATAKGLGKKDDAAKEGQKLIDKLNKEALQAELDSNDMVIKDANDMLEELFNNLKAFNALKIAESKVNSQERLDIDIKAIEDEMAFRLNSEELSSTEIETLQLESLTRITELKSAQRIKEQQEQADFDKQDLENRLQAIDDELAAYEEAEAVKQEIRQRGIELGQEAVNTIFEIKRNADEKELDNLNSNLDQQLISQEEYDKQVAAIRRKQAVRDKAQALFNIGIQTAENIVKAGLNPVLAAIAAAIGALQASVVLSKPLNFYEGTEYVEQGKFKRGRDTIPAMVNIGERIITTKENEKNWDVYESLRKGNFERYVHMNYVAPAMNETLTNFKKQEKQEFADNIYNSMVLNAQGFSAKDLKKVFNKGIVVRNMPDDEDKISIQEYRLLERRLHG